MRSLGSSGRRLCTHKIVFTSHWCVTITFPAQDCADALPTSIFPGLCPPAEHTLLILLTAQHKARGHLLNSALTWLLNSSLRLCLCISEGWISEVCAWLTHLSCQMPFAPASSNLWMGKHLSMNVNSHSWTCKHDCKHRILEWFGL